MNSWHTHKHAANRAPAVPLANVPRRLRRPILLTLGVGAACAASAVAAITALRPTWAASGAEQGGGPMHLVVQVVAGISVLLGGFTALRCYARPRTGRTATAYLWGVWVGVVLAVLCWLGGFGFALYLLGLLVGAAVLAGIVSAAAVLTGHAGAGNRWFWWAWVVLSVSGAVLPVEFVLPGIGGLAWWRGLLGPDRDALPGTLGLLVAGFSAIGSLILAFVPEMSESRAAAALGHAAAGIGLAWLVWTVGPYVLAGSV